MRKDIDFPEVRNIYIAAVKQWDDAFLNQTWNVYLINQSSKEMELTIVVSRGSSNNQKTATLRHGLGTIAPNSFKKIEFITEEVLCFKNEFLLTFFSEGKLYDRTFVFEANQIDLHNAVKLPLLEEEGVLAN